MKSYSILLYHDLLEPETWYGVVPAVPGVISDGDSQLQALQMTTEALELMLEYCLESGQMLPKDSFDLELAKQHVLAFFESSAELEFVVKSVNVRFEVSTVAA